MQIWNKTGQILPEIRVAGAEETEIEICSDNPINACSPFLPDFYRCLSSNSFYVVIKYYHSNQTFGRFVFCPFLFSICISLESHYTQKN